METEKATGPAWQVRESARQEFLKRIHQKIILEEDELGKDDLHWTLLRLIQRWLSFWRAKSRAGIRNDDDFPEISSDEKTRMLNLFHEIESEIHQFERTKEEGVVLFAELLEWLAKEIARPFCSALQAQEVLEPEKIFGVGGAMEEVPFE
jgi:hypothetical protein